MAAMPAAYVGRTGRGMMTKQFDAEKWLRVSAEHYDYQHREQLTKCADELAAANYKAEHYEYMYRELNIHTNKHADKLRDELTEEKEKIARLEAINALQAQSIRSLNEQLEAAEGIGRKLYEALKLYKKDQNETEALLAYEELTTALAEYEGKRNDQQRL